MDWRSTLTVALLGLGCGPAVENPPALGSTTADETGSTGPGTLDPAPPLDVPGGPECEPYLDELDSRLPTQVEIRNTGTDTLLLPNDCGIDFLFFDSVDGATWPGPYCGDTCHHRFEFGCQACEGCASGSYLGVAPGASFVFEWLGELFETETPPGSCFAEAGCGPDCQQMIAADDGTAMTVRVIATSVAACEAGGQTCACPPSDSKCDIYGTPAGADREASQVFAVGDANVVVEF